MAIRSVINLVMFNIIHTINIAHCNSSGIPEHRGRHVNVSNQGCPDEYQSIYGVTIYMYTHYVHVKRRYDENIADENRHTWTDYIDKEKTSRSC